MRKNTNKTKTKKTNRRRTQRAKQTITELTAAVREEVALKLLKLQTSKRGSGRGRGRGTVCRGHDLQNTNTGKDEREVRKNPGINRRQETIFLGKIFTVNNSQNKKNSETYPCPTTTTTYPI